MKNNSIRQTLPRLVWMMIVLLTVLILPANIRLQSYMKHESQRESAYEVFAQIKQLIEMSEKDLENDKKDFSEKCIQAADMAAYFVQHYPETKTDLRHTRQLAEKLQVDEIHYITPEGEVFLPMLEDKTMKLCQEIMQLPEDWAAMNLRYFCTVTIPLKTWKTRWQNCQKNVETCFYQKI